MRGICLAARRLGEARAILLEWAGAVSEGMLPSRFADDSRRATSTASARAASRNPWASNYLA